MWGLSSRVRAHFIRHKVTINPLRTEVRLIPLSTRSQSRISYLGRDCESDSDLHEGYLWLGRVTHNGESFDRRKGRNTKMKRMPSRIRSLSAYALFILVDALMRSLPVSDLDVLTCVA